MSDEILDILRRGVKLEYEPPESTVEAEVPQSRDPDISRTADAVYTTQEIVDTYNELIKEVDILTEQVRANVGAAAVALPIGTIFSIEELEALGISASMTYGQFKGLEEQPYNPTAIRLRDYYIDYHLSEAIGNMDVFALSDLENIGYKLRETLGEIVKSGFYIEATKEGMGVYYDRIQDIYSSPTGKDYFSRMTEYYLKNASQSKKQTDIVKSYLMAGKFRLAECLWKSFIGRMVGEKDLSKLLKKIEGITRLLKTMSLAFQIGMIIPNLNLKGLMKKITNIFKNAIKRQLRRQLVNASFRVAMDVLHPMKELLYNMEDVADCPFLTDLTSYLSSMTTEEIFNLNKWLSNQLLEEEYKGNLLKKKYKSLIDKKEFKRIMEVLGTVIKYLEDFKNRRGLLREEWFDELFDKAQKESDGRIGSLPEKNIVVERPRVEGLIRTEGNVVGA